MSKTMAETNESLAVKIGESLTKIAPVGTHFVVIYVLPDDDHFGMTSNMSDDSAIAILEDAIDSIDNAPPIPIEKLETIN